MVVVVAVAAHARIYGLTLFASGFLATNARMVVARAVTTHAGIYGALAFCA